MPESTQLNSNKKKQSLGRGLGSLFGENTDVSERPTPAATEPAPVQISDESQVWMVPIDRLNPNTQQPRQTFTSEALKELSASIKQKGILQPIVARRLAERDFEIIAGERRWRAAQMAGLHEVPVILKKVTEQDSLEYAIIENIQREDLNPMEEAEAYENLLKRYSLTQQQIADKLGKDRATVANSLRLLGLPPEVKELVRQKELSTGHAKVLLGVEDATSLIALAKQVIQEKLSVRNTERLAAKIKTELRAPGLKKDSLDMDVPRRLIDGLSGELQKLVGSKVSIDYSEGKGKLQIHFYSDEQLTQMVEKIRRAWAK